MEGWRVFFRRIGVPMLLASLVAAACNPLTESAPKAGVDIVIGVPNSATGSLSAEGGLSKQGYDLWQDWANRDGGSWSRVYDTRSSSSTPTTRACPPTLRSSRRA